MKNNNIPLYLWFLWCVACLYISSPWQYLRHSYADNALLSCIFDFCVLILFCTSPLFFRFGLLVTKSLFKCNFTFFVKKRSGSKESTLHLSPYADTRHPESMRKHWEVLLRLISEAIVHDDIVIMHSHLLTPARIKKLIKKLKSHGINFTVNTYPRKTNLYEKLSIPFVYLLFHWTFPHLHSNGMTVVIRSRQTTPVN